MILHGAGYRVRVIGGLIECVADRGLFKVVPVKFGPYLVRGVFGEIFM